MNKFLYRRGGAEAYMLDVADRQREQGHVVELFGMQHPQNGPLRFAAHFPPQVELDPLPERTADRLRAAGRMFYSPASRKGLTRVLEEFQPDVVHLHNIYHQLSPSVLRAVEDAHVPAVMTLHDYKLACPSYLMLAGNEVCDACLDGRFRHAVAKRCKGGSLPASALLAAESAYQRRRHAYDPVQRFLCPSRFLTDVMTSAGVYVDRLRVVPNFVDTAPIAAKTSAGGGAIYVGRLSPEKGVETLVEAAGLDPSLRVDIVGEGPEEPTLKTLAERRAPGRVTFHGRVSRDRVLDLVRGSAVVVLPSHCNENQPLAVLEAFACGVPVIASALGGLPELVPEGCGFLVAPRDAAALSERLGTVLGDPEAAMSMGARARSTVLARHSPRDHLVALDAAYRDAARERSRGSAALPPVRRRVEHV
ncbi:MAG TPA: glycosyltransferase [Nocardioidaceae bacterium]|nr:glycosyltransferase [Nocardioidaceae bacterium]